MRKFAPTIPVTPEMFRHFAVITVAMTGGLAMFADGENREAIEQAVERSQRPHSGRVAMSEAPIPERGGSGKTIDQGMSERRSQVSRMGGGAEGDSGGDGDGGGDGGGYIDAAPAPNSVRWPARGPAAQAKGMATPAAMAGPRRRGKPDPGSPASGPGERTQQAPSETSLDRAMEASRQRAMGDGSRDESLED